MILKGKTNRELGGLYDGLVNVSRVNGANIKFSYAVSKNMRKLKQFIDDLKEVLKPTEEFKKYDTARIEICEKYCEKDEALKPKFTPQGNYIIKPEEQLNFAKEIEKLDHKNKKIVDERKRITEEFESMLDEKVEEFELHDILYSTLPETLIPSQLEGILDMVVEDVDPMAKPIEDKKKK